MALNLGGDSFNPNYQQTDQMNPVSAPPATTGTTSGSTPFDFLNSGSFGNILSNIGTNAYTIPYLLSAVNNYNNSGKYMDMATKYSDQLNPFGSQRAYYQDKLKQLYTDPNAYLQTSPDYQAALKQGMAALDSSMSAKGYSGSGHAADEAIGYGSQLGAQYLNQDRNALMQMAGAGIGPNAAAAMMMTGLQGAIQSDNNALSNAMGAFTKLNQNPGGGSNGGGGTPFTGGNAGWTSSLSPALASQLASSRLGATNLASLGTQLGAVGFKNGMFQLRDGTQIDPTTGTAYNSDGSYAGYNAYGPGDTAPGYEWPAGSFGSNVWDSLPIDPNSSVGQLDPSLFNGLDMSNINVGDYLNSLGDLSWMGF